MNDGRAEPRELLLYRIPFALEEFPPLVVDQPKLAADGRQTQVRVVLAQRQTRLGAAGEHAVRLGRTAGDEVIHQHADVSLAALRAPGFAAAGCERSIDARQQPLRCGLLVTGGAVDLTGEEQAGDEFALQTVSQIARIEKIVLDGIARPRDVRAFESLDRSDEFMLDVERQTGGYAVRVDLVSIETLGLDENLMRRPVGEAHDLAFHRRAIARSHALDQTREHGRALAGGANDVVGALVGGRDVAGHLARMRGSRTQK